MLPFEYIRAPTLVSETFGRVGKGILRRLELHKVGFCVGMVVWSHCLIRMVYGSSVRAYQLRSEMKLLRDAVQSPKPRLDSLLVNIDRQVQVLVEVSIDSDPVVGFIYGIKQVDDYDCDVYPPPVLEIFRSAGLRLWVTGTYHDAVI